VTVGNSIAPEVSKKPIARFRAQLPLADAKDSGFRMKTIKGRARTHDSCFRLKSKTARRHIRARAASGDGRNRKLVKKVKRWNCRPSGGCGKGSATRKGGGPPGDAEVDPSRGTTDR